ncbi:MAG: FAD-dependent thymidylate synthase [Myxococcota bacterium]
MLEPLVEQTAFKPANPTPSAAPQRVRVPELDNVLGRPFGVLDDGFVRLVDYMGNDQAVVQAARVSYGAGTKKVSQDRGLIRYLMRHHHTTPFEMCEIKLHVRVPMDTWRQWVRHRTANINEYSTRYSLAIDSASVTKARQWRQQATNNRQGSEGNLTLQQGKHLSQQEQKLQSFSQEIYQERIKQGVAREQARKDLPLSTYTEAYWKIDLHNLLHFLRLRMHLGAQQEIRNYAHTIGHELVKRWCPLVWEAFMDYHVNCMTFSVAETTLIKHLAQGKTQRAIEYAQQLGWLTRKDDGCLKAHRERQECQEKLLHLGFTVPW